MIIKIKEYLIKENFKNEISYNRRFLIAIETCRKFLEYNWNLDTTNLMTEFKVILVGPYNQPGMIYGIHDYSSIIISNDDLEDFMTQYVIES